MSLACNDIVKLASAKCYSVPCTPSDLSAVRMCVARGYLTQTGNVSKIHGIQVVAFSFIVSFIYHVTPQQNE